MRRKGRSNLSQMMCNRNRREELKKNGLCVYCGNNPPSKQRFGCEECYNKKRLKYEQKKVIENGPKKD